MGALSFAVSYETLPGLSPPEPRDVLKDVHDSLWHWLGQSTGHDFASVDDYQPDALREGLAKAWSATASELQYWFPDRAGLCWTSSTACIHWLSVALPIIGDRVN